MGRLVGREAELAALVATVTRPPAVAVVEGEAGIGKTRLVGELPARPELAGRRLVTGVCRRIRDPFPLGPVLDVVRALVADRPPYSPVVGALRPLLPEVAERLPASLPPAADPASLRHRVFRAVVEVIDRAGPVVLVLEDLHWSDAQTVELLRYLLAEPPAGLSLVVTYRPDDAGDEARSLAVRLPMGVEHCHLALAPLDARQTAAMAAAVLAVARVPSPFADRLHARAGGLPFAIEQLLALLADRGALPGPDDQAAFRALDTLAVPQPIREYVRERVTRLPGGARPVLEAAAVLSRAAPEWLLAAVAGEPPAVVAEALSHGIEAGLLTDHGAATGFRHVLAAQAVYEGIPGPRLRAWHAAAAAALEAPPGNGGPPVAGGEPETLGEVAYHLRRAGLAGRWREVAERAADRAAALGHDDEAARLLEEVLREASLSDDARGRLAVKLGRAAARTLRRALGAATVLTAALERPLARAVRGELRLRLAILLEHTGAPFARQWELFAAAVPDLRDHPELQAHAMVALGVPGVPGFGYAAHRRWLDRIQEILPAVADPGIRLGLRGKVAMALVEVGDPRWRALAGRVVADTGGVPRRLVEVGGYHSVGEAACYAGHLGRADGLLAAALSGAVACHNRWRAQWLRATRTLLDYCRGAWDGLAERADTLADQLTGHAPGHADVEVAAACLALARGDPRAGGLLSAAVARLERRAGHDLLPVPVAAAVRLATGRGDLAAALAMADRFVRGVESMPFVVAAVRALPALVEALLAGDRRADAEALVERWGGAVRRLDAPLAPAALRHAGGLLAGAAGQGRAAVGLLTAAAAEYQRLPAPYEAAQAREQAAGYLFAAGDPDAAPTLRAALATYRRLGAEWDLARAARLARRQGVPAPPRHRRGRRGYGPALSPRERQVATLAATGRTNKEIARELFVQPDTVNKHLRGAMRKLAVRTRTALARKLAEPAAGEPAARELAGGNLAAREPAAGETAGGEPAGE